MTKGRTVTTERHNQYEVALRDKKNWPVIAIGSAGTGKTCGAVGRAIEWVQGGRKGSKKILVTRPQESFAAKSGYLPGTEREKMDPWIRPIQQNFDFHGVKAGQQECWEKAGTLSYMPLEHIQGLTFDDTFILMDECQNANFEQLKGFLTRTGKYSKVVLCGDIKQVSPTFRNSGLARLMRAIDKYNVNVHSIEFHKEDILRSEECKMWIDIFEKEERDGGK